MTTLFLILSILLAGVALFLTLRPFVPSTFIAYLSLWMVKWSGVVAVPEVMLIFWGIATLLTLVINNSLPRQASKSIAGAAYISGSSLAGMLVGLISSYQLMIIGAAVGALFGAMAYSRTPQGSTIKKPASRFIQYVASKGLPTIITISLIGIVIQLLILSR